MEGDFKVLKTHIARELRDSDSPERGQGLGNDKEQFNSIVEKAVQELEDRVSQLPETDSLGELISGLSHSVLSDQVEDYNKHLRSVQERLLRIEQQIELAEREKMLVGAVTEEVEYNIISKLSLVNDGLRELRWCIRNHLEMADYVSSTRTLSEYLSDFDKTLGHLSVISKELSLSADNVLLHCQDANDASFDLQGLLHTFSALEEKFTEFEIAYSHCFDGLDEMLNLLNRVQNNDVFDPEFTDRVGGLYYQISGDFGGDSDLHYALQGLCARKEEVEAIYKNISALVVQKEEFSGGFKVGAEVSADEASEVKIEPLAEPDESVAEGGVSAQGLEVPDPSGDAGEGEEITEREKVYKECVDIFDREQTKVFKILEKQLGKARGIAEKVIRQKTVALRNIQKELSALSTDSSISVGRIIELIDEVLLVRRGVGARTQVMRSLAFLKEIKSKLTIIRKEDGEVVVSTSPAQEGVSISSDSKRSAAQNVNLEGSRVLDLTSPPLQEEVSQTPSSFAQEPQHQDINQLFSEHSTASPPLDLARDAINYINFDPEQTITSKMIRPGHVDFSQEGSRRGAPVETPPQEASFGLGPETARSFPAEDEADLSNLFDLLETSEEHIVEPLTLEIESRDEETLDDMVRDDYDWSSKIPGGATYTFEDWNNEETPVWETREESITAEKCTSALTNVMSKTDSLWISENMITGDAILSDLQNDPDWNILVKLANAEQILKLVKEKAQEVYAGKKQASGLENGSTILLHGQRYVIVEKNNLLYRSDEGGFEVLFTRFDDSQNLSIEQEQAYTALMKKKLVEWNAEDINSVFGENSITAQGLSNVVQSNEGVSEPGAKEYKIGSLIREKRWLEDRELEDVAIEAVAQAIISRDVTGLTPQDLEKSGFQGQEQELGVVLNNFEQVKNGLEDPLNFTGDWQNVYWPVVVGNYRFSDNDDLDQKLCASIREEMAQKIDQTIRSYRLREGEKYLLKEVDRDGGDVSVELTFNYNGFPVFLGSGTNWPVTDYNIGNIIPLQESQPDRSSETHTEVTSHSDSSISEVFPLFSESSSEDLESQVEEGPSFNIDLSPAQVIELLGDDFQRRVEAAVSEAVDSAKGNESIFDFDQDLFDGIDEDEFRRLGIVGVDFNIFKDFCIREVGPKITHQIQEWVNYEAQRVYSTQPWWKKAKKILFSGHPRRKALVGACAKMIGKPMGTVLTLAGLGGLTGGAIGAGMGLGAGRFITRYGQRIRTSIQKDMTEAKEIYAEIKADIIQTDREIQGTDIHNRLKENLVENMSAMIAQTMRHVSAGGEKANTVFIQAKIRKQVRQEMQTGDGFDQKEPEEQEAILDHVVAELTSQLYGEYPTEKMDQMIEKNAGLAGMLRKVVDLRSGELLVKNVQDEGEKTKLAAVVYVGMGAIGGAVMAGNPFAREAFVGVAGGLTGADIGRKTDIYEAELSLVEELTSGEGNPLSAVEHYLKSDNPDLGHADFLSDIDRLRTIVHLEPVQENIMLRSRIQAALREHDREFFDNPSHEAERALSALRVMNNELRDVQQEVVERLKEKKSLKKEMLYGAVGGALSVVGFEMFSWLREEVSGPNTEQESGTIRQSDERNDNAVNTQPKPESVNTEQTHTELEENLAGRNTDQTTEQTQDTTNTQQGETRISQKPVVENPTNQDNTPDAPIDESEQPLGETDNTSVFTVEEGRTRLLDPINHFVKEQGSRIVDALRESDVDRVAELEQKYRALGFRNSREVGGEQALTEQINKRLLHDWKLAMLKEQGVGVRSVSAIERAQGDLGSLESQESELQSQLDDLTANANPNPEQVTILKEQLSVLRAAKQNALSDTQWNMSRATRIAAGDQVKLTIVGGRPELSITRATEVVPETDSVPTSEPKGPNTEDSALAENTKEKAEQQNDPNVVATIAQGGTLDQAVGDFLVTEQGQTYIDTWANSHSDEVDAANAFVERQGITDETAKLEARNRYLTGLIKRDVAQDILGEERNSDGSITYVNTLKSGAELTLENGRLVVNEEGLGGRVTIASQAEATLEQPNALALQQLREGKDVSVWQYTGDSDSLLSNEYFKTLPFTMQTADGQTLTLRGTYEGKPFYTMGQVDTVYDINGSAIGTKAGAGDQMRITGSSGLRDVSIKSRVVSDTGLSRDQIGGMRVLRKEGVLSASEQEGAQNRQDLSNKQYAATRSWTIPDSSSRVIESEPELDESVQVEEGAPVEEGVLTEESLVEELPRAESPPELPSESELVVDAEPESEIPRSLSFSTDNILNGRVDVSTGGDGAVSVNVTGNVVGMSPAKLVESGVVSRDAYTQHIRARPFITLQAKNIYLYSEAYKQALEQNNSETVSLLKNTIDRLVQSANRRYGSGSFPEFSPPAR